MKIYPITSSVIESVVDFLDDDLYAETGIQVRFKSGAVYRVPNATPQLLSNFLAAKSAGAFFNEIVKPNFAVEVVQEEWLTCGTAQENIFAGDSLEQNPRTGLIRRLRLPDLK